MNNDKTSVPKYLNINIEKNTELLDFAEGINKDERTEEEEAFLDFCSIDAGWTFSPEELYLDDETDTIHMSGTMDRKEGRILFTIEVPLSTSLVLDFLEYSVKRLNKMKAAMEALR